MLTNNEIKRIKSLQRKKERVIYQQFIVEGVKMVEELIKSDFEIVNIYTTEDAFLNHPAAEKVSTSDLSRISQLKTANEVLAIVAIPNSSNINPNKTAIILEGINDPGNLGTIIRTADWYGISQIICSENAVDCYNSKVVNATMGSLFRVNVRYTDLGAYLIKSTLPSYGAILGGKVIDARTFTKDCNLVFGSESHGLSEQIKSKIDHKITIAGAGNAESLNLSIATGIICDKWFCS